MASFSAVLKADRWKLLIWLSLCNFAICWDYPFRNLSLSWDERVEDLVYRLSLYEIVDQTSTSGVHSLSAVPRLGIQPYLWDTECLRGYVNHNATAFPDSLGLAASFRYVSNGFSWFNGSSQLDTRSTRHTDFSVTSWPLRFQGRDELTVLF